MLRMRKKPPSDRPNINSGQAWSAMDMEGLLDLHETGEPARVTIRRARRSAVEPVLRE